MLACGFWLVDSWRAFVVSFAVAVLWGWPFCAVVAIPLTIAILFREKLFSTITSGIIALFLFVVRSSSTRLTISLQ